MDPLLYAILYLLASYFLPKHNRQIQFLKLQLEIQRRVLARHGITRVFSDPEDKMRLLALGKEMNHNVKDILVIVGYHTYKNWLRKIKNGEALQKPGRPKIVCPKLIASILRFAKDNPTWGLSRIYGELKKVGDVVATNTIKRILRGFPSICAPPPRGPKGGYRPCRWGLL